MSLDGVGEESVARRGVKHSNLKDVLLSIWNITEMAAVKGITGQLRRDDTGCQWPHYAEKYYCVQSSDYKLMALWIVAMSQRPTE